MAGILVVNQILSIKSGEDSKSDIVYQIRGVYLNKKKKAEAY